MSAWQTLAVNGALADSLIDDFGGANSPISALPPDARACLLFHFSADAEIAVQLYLAISNAAADENIEMIWDSTYQTNPAADSTQWVTSGQISIPIQNGLLHQFRITKAAADANVRWCINVKMGPE